MNPFPPLVPAFQWKQGDSFVANCQYKQGGVNTDFTGLGISVTSQVRRPDGALVATLTFTPGVTGAYELRDNTTSDWPLGYLVWDIKYATASVVFHTDTLVFEMVKRVTA